MVVIRRLYDRKMEKGLQEFVLFGQVSIVLSCLLVLAMFYAVRRRRQALARYGNIREDADSGNS